MLFRTAEGTKLVSAAMNNHVLFEADDHTVAEGWSVILKGMTRMLRTDEELAKAERAQLLPWTATLKNITYAFNRFRSPAAGFGLARSRSASPRLPDVRRPSSALRPAPQLRPRLAGRFS